MAAPNAAGNRYVPGWTVITVEGVVSSRCTPCGWPHTTRSPDLATIARIDHEYGHRTGLYPPTATPDDQDQPAPVFELVAA
jgi:hypothetical protein